MTYTTRSSARLQNVSRGGFSFVEILFAVMILGIGFIMVAAIFPVALRQTQESGDETVASTVAKGGATYLAEIAPQADLIVPPGPATQPTYMPDAYVNTTGRGIVMAGDYRLGLYAGDFYRAVSGNLVLPSDKRYAWVPFFRRDKGSPYAQVIVIGCQVRSASVYDPVADVVSPNGTLPPTLQGKLVQVKIQPGVSGGPDQITFSKSMNASADFTGAVAEGCYVVIANDPNTTPVSVTPYVAPLSANGYVYRVGNIAQSPPAPAGTWELMPGNDTQKSYFPTAACDAYIVGRGYDPSNPGTFTGPAQDIAVYTTFVKAN